MRMFHRHIGVRACAGARAIGLAGAALVAAAQGLHAQALDSRGTNSDVYTDLSGYLLSNAPGYASATPGIGPGATSVMSDRSAIFQSGGSNAATLNMQGAGNTSVQLQFGTANSSALIVTGDRNAVGTGQFGNNNNAAISVTGQGNTVIDSQVGNNLSFSLQQVGDGKTVVVRQFGQGR